MRWVKHMTDSRDDEKIAQLLDTGGHAAYGLWWMLVEIVAKQSGSKRGDDKCSVTYPRSGWAMRLICRPHDVSSKLHMVAICGLITTSSDGQMITVRIPNILKYRDEYTARVGTKSGHSHEQNSEGDTDTDGKAEGEQKPASAPRPKQPTEPPGYALDELYAEFRKACAWLDLIPEDFHGQAWFVWRTLDPEQKGAAIAGMRTRAESGMDPAHVPRPKRYLEGREWTRKPKVAAIRETKMERMLREIAES